MKKLITLLAVLGLTHTAQADTEFNIKGEYRVRGAITSGSNLQDDRTENAVRHRFKLSNEYIANDKVSAQLTLVYNGGWGTSDVELINGSIVTDRSDRNPNNATNNKLGNNTGIIVNEAYATWAMSDEFTLKLGRGSFEGGDATSSAINDFQDVMTAFDGIAGIYDTDFARITGYLIKFADFNFADSTRSPNFDPEANTVGVNADLKLAPEIFEYINIGVNQVKQDEYNIVGAPAPVNAESFIKYSLSAKANFADMFSVRGTYSANTGEYSNIAGLKGDISSSMLDLEAGINLEDSLNFKFHIGYHQDSGNKSLTSGTDGSDDEAYNSYYYDVHRYAGLMDVVRWGNLTYISAKTSIEPIENFTVGLDYHIFTATEAGGETTLAGYTTDLAGFGPIAGINSSAASAVNTADDDIGSEIDLYATHKYDNGLTLTARYGLFMVGDRIKNATFAGVVPLNAEDQQTFFIEGTFRF